MLKRVSIIFLISFLTIIGCSRPLTDDNNGSTIELSEAAVFEIELQGEAQSGYEWRIISENNHVKLTEPIITETNGATTESTFKFKTVGTGEDKLILAYTNGTDTKKYFKLTVIVGTMGRIEAY